MKNLEIYPQLFGDCDTLEGEIQILRDNSYKKMKPKFNKFVKILLNAVPVELKDALSTIKDYVDFDVPTTKPIDPDSRKPKLFYLLSSGESYHDCMFIRDSEVPFFSAEEIEGLNKAWEPFGLYVKEFSHAEIQYTYHISRLPKTLLHLQEKKDEE